jgi:hypothetical protein
MMTETEIFEYARKKRPLEVYAMAASAFRENGIDPSDLIGLPADEQKRIIDRVRGSRQGLKPTITPEEHMLNQAALDALTRQIGATMGTTPEPWKPGQIVGAEYLEDEPEIVAFGDDVAASLQAHRPYLEFVLSEQRKAAERERVIADAKAKIMAEADRRYRVSGPVMAPEAAEERVIVSGWKPGEIEEV